MVSTGLPFAVPRFMFSRRTSGIKSDGISFFGFAHIPGTGISSYHVPLDLIELYNSIMHKIQTS